jgi:hypothetical protein
MKLIAHGLKLTQDKDGSVRIKFDPDLGILVQRVELSIDAANQMPLVKLYLCPGHLDVLVEKFALVAEEVKEVGPDGVQRVFVLNDNKVHHFDKDGTPVPSPAVEAAAGTLFTRQEPADGCGQVTHG